MDLDAILLGEKVIVNSRMRIGESIRHFRKQKGLSLSQLGLASNVSKSNISKIENGMISPTFEIMERISNGLGIPTANLLSDNVPGVGRQSFNKSNSGPISVDGHYEFEFLFSNFVGRRMVPFVTTVTASGPDDVKQPAKHGGEEFFYVLSGSVIFTGSGGKTTMMEVGDSIYFDSHEEHLVVNQTDIHSKLLWVWLE